MGSLIISVAHVHGSPFCGVPDVGAKHAYMRTEAATICNVKCTGLAIAHIQCGLCLKACCPKRVCT